MPGAALGERRVVRRLAFIRAATNVGLTLQEVRGELERLDDQIRALEELRDGLDSCIGCGCLSLKGCT